MAVERFHWQDGERLIVFGQGAISEAPGLLGDGYALLTTERAAARAPDVVRGAAAVHEVAPGRVDEIAAELRAPVAGELLVALGGGRVVDVAKALAAADPPRRVAAIPTTLSGAEMTPIHRQVAGLPLTTPRVRPAIVINDPSLSASQSLPELAASAANALGHAAEGPLTPLTNPVAALAALEAARLLSAGFRGDADSDGARAALAQGALLAGYVIGSTGYGLHHVMAQTLVRFAGVGHGPANALLLPLTLEALHARSPAPIERLSEALGEPAAAFAARLRALTGAERLSELGLTDEQLVQCAREAATRPELALTPPPADEAELLELYRAAY